MAKMHGENVYNHAARQLGEVGKKEVNAEYAANSKPNSIEIPVLCKCPWRPFPHWHTLFERVKQIKIWNQQSKHRLRLPTEFKEQGRSFQNSAAQAAGKR